MTKNISSSEVIYRCRNWTICTSSPWKIDPALLHSGGTPSFFDLQWCGKQNVPKPQSIYPRTSFGWDCIIIPNFRLIGWVMMGLFPRLDWSWTPNWSQCLFLGPKSLGAAIFSCARASPTTKYPESIVSRGPPKLILLLQRPTSRFLRYYVQTLHLHRCLLEKKHPCFIGGYRGYVNSGAEWQCPRLETIRSSA